MIQDRGTLTDLRKEVLLRLCARGPLDRDEANEGRFNCIPALLRLGWIRSRYGIKQHVVYEITDAGLMVIGRRDLITESASVESKT